MSIQHKENGIDLIRANGEVISLTLNEAYEIYHEMDMQNIKSTIIWCIGIIEQDDWPFTTTKEEVLSDADLMADFVDLVNYENLNLDDDADFWYMLEKYLN